MKFSEAVDEMLDALSTGGVSGEKTTGKAVQKENQV